MYLRLRKATYETVKAMLDEDIIYIEELTRALISAERNDLIESLNLMSTKTLDIALCLNIDSVCYFLIRKGIKYSKDTRANIAFFLSSNNINNQDFEEFIGYQHIRDGLEYIEYIHAKEYMVYHMLVDILIGNKNVVKLEILSKYYDITERINIDSLFKQPSKNRHVLRVVLKSLLKTDMTKYVEITKEYKLTIDKYKLIDDDAESTEEIELYL